MVVPTGAPWFASPTCISAICANRWPACTTNPRRANNVCDGSLYGNGINPSRIAPPGASTSLNSPGCKGESSSLIRRPRALNPAGRFDNVPESSNCLNACVADLDSPPIKCTKPNP